MRATVIDASVVLRWAFSDEPDRDGAVQVARALASGAVTAVGPPHFLLEVAAALAIGIRTRRIDRMTADAMLGELVKVSIPEEDPHGFATAAYRLALDGGIRVPDAAYIETARRTEAILITADAAQLRAASEAGVTATRVSEVPAWTPDDS